MGEGFEGLGQGLILGGVFEVVGDLVEPRRSIAARCRGRLLETLLAGIRLVAGELGFDDVVLGAADGRIRGVAQLAGDIVHAGGLSLIGGLRKLILGGGDLPLSFSELVLLLGGEGVVSLLEIIEGGLGGFEALGGIFHRGGEVFGGLVVEALGERRGVGIEVEELLLREGGLRAAVVGGAVVGGF